METAQRFVDEDTQNEIWIEAAYESFHDALSCGEYQLAEDIMKDAEEYGFPAAKTMKEDLIKAKTGEHE